MHLALGLNPSFRATAFCGCVRKSVLNSGVPVCFCVCEDKKKAESPNPGQWPNGHLCPTYSDELQKHMEWLLEEHLSHFYPL